MGITRNVGTVDQLVTALIDSQGTLGQTGQNVITLTALTYNLSTYSGISSIPTNNAFGIQNWEKSGLPHIKTDVLLKISASLSTAIITRNLTGPAYRHFYVEGAGKLTLQNLTLKNGDVGTVDTGGGAVNVDGRLEAYNCVFGPDNISNYGGAILNYLGTVVLDNCEISGNKADWGGGLYNYLNCHMDITDSRIANNQSVPGANNAGGLINFGIMNVTHCTITGNTAGSGGGLASWDSAAQLTIFRSFITNNVASVGGAVYAQAGSIQISCSTIVDNIAGIEASVAYNNGGSISILSTALPTDSNGNKIDFTNPSDTTYVRLMTIQPTEVLLYRRPEFTLQYDTTSRSLLPYYQYNRHSAAEYAIKESRYNFGTQFPYGVSDLRSPVIGTVGGPFIYHQTVLDHTGNKTGSAIFMSESIYAGGFPQAYTLGTGGVPDPAQCSQNTGSKTSGWHLCSGNSATQSWKDHLEVTNYFKSYGGTFLATLPHNTVATYVAFGTGAQVTNAQALYNMFNTGGAYATLDTGDYVYFDLGTCGKHGLLIVGWGPAVDVYNGVNARTTSEPADARTSFSISRQVNSVPYVADFCYGYNGSNTGWLQDPRPRPFYCSNVSVQAANMGLFPLNIVQPGTTGMPDIADYSLRLRGNYNYFTYSTVANCKPPFNLPAWRFMRMPNSMPLTYNQIFWAQC